MTEQLKQILKIIGLSVAIISMFIIAGLLESGRIEQLGL